METKNKKQTASLVLTVSVVVLSLVLLLLVSFAVLGGNEEDSSATSGTTRQTASPSTVDSKDNQSDAPEKTDPTQPSESKPAEADPSDPEPSEPKPTEPKPTEPKPTEPKPTEPKPTEPKPTEPKPTEPKPSEPDEDPQKTPERIAAEEKISAFAAQHGFTLEDYSEKLIDLLARKPETEEYVLNFPLEYGKDHPIDISGWADYEGVPLFIQWDKQWGYLDYTGNVAGLAACGPTCMSMIMYHFTRDPKYTPAYMMDFAQSNSRYAVKGYGTQWAFFKEGGKELGLNVKELNSDQIASEKAIAKVLDSGRIIVMNVRPGVFTTIGHYLLVVGYEDGKFRVNDPNSIINSEKLWEFEEFSDQIKMMWSFAP